MHAHCHFFHPRCSTTGETLTHYATLKSIGHSTSAQVAKGTRHWHTMKKADTAVTAGVTAVINSFVSLADPTGENSMATTMKQGPMKQRMGYMTQSTDAQPQMHNRRLCIRTVGITAA